MCGGAGGYLRLEVAALPAEFVVGELIYNVIFGKDAFEYGIQLLEIPVCL